MEGSRNNGGFTAVAVAVVVLMLILTTELAAAELIKVGDAKGWNPNVNYTEWSSKQHIYVNDWIIFNFDKHYYNVLEVNQTSYEKCIDQNFIKNITKGGRDVYQLREPRPYYFLSGGGYCFNGMKVAIYVEKFSPALAPSPATNGSSASKSAILPVIVSLAFVWAFFFFKMD